MTPPKIQRDYYALLTNPKGDRVLLYESADGWKMPYWESGRPGHTQVETPQTIGTIQELTGLKVVLLMNYVRTRTQSGENSWHIRRVFAAEVFEGQPTPDGAGWFTLPEIENLQFADALTARDVRDWLQENTNPANIPALRVPWARPGWYAGVTNWLNAQMARLGWEITGEISLRKFNCISALLKVPTSAGEVYMKAVPNYFGTEPQFSQPLERLIPGKVPHILAVDVERGFILMADFKGAPLDDQTDIEPYKEAVREYAQLQIACVPHTQELIAAGARHYPLSKMAERITNLFNRRELMRIGEPLVGLTPEEADRVAAVLPRVIEMCTELEAFGLPETIETGDFHAYNVATTANGYVFYDWSDLTITQPFVSLPPFVFNADNLQEIPGFAETLRDAYLEPWQEYAPLEKLHEAYKLGYTLGMVTQLLNYEYIFDNLEDRDKWEVEQAFGGFYKDLLEQLS
jgi:hypothetical protein